MATIVDYTSLNQALQDFLARSDIAGYPDYFIQQAENRIYRDVFELNQGRGLRQMEASLTGTITNNNVPVPADYLGLKMALITIGNGNFPLDLKSPEFIFTTYPIQAATGSPSFIARYQGNFIFGPYADAAYTVSGTYWQKAAALSSTNTVTWMITYMPDVLFAACMAVAAKFVRDNDAMQVWEAVYMDGLAKFVVADKAEAWAESNLAITSA